MLEFWLKNIVSRPWLYDPYFIQIDGPQVLKLKPTHPILEIYLNLPWRSIQTYPGDLSKPTLEINPNSTLEIYLNLPYRSI